MICTTLQYYFNKPSNHSKTRLSSFIKLGKVSLGSGWLTVYSDLHLRPMGSSAPWKTETEQGTER